MDTRESSVPRPRITEDAPHACYEGVVYIGHLVEDECGEEVEVIEAVPCRRCAEVL
jgi:hypothetical protein